jgi:hypothetical protein
MPSGSRPLTGSSRITTSGSPRRAEAIPSRSPMPSENRPARFFATDSRPTSSINSSTRLRAIPRVCASASRGCQMSLTGHGRPDIGARVLRREDVRPCQATRRSARGTFPNTGAGGGSGPKLSQPTNSSRRSSESSDHNCPFRTGAGKRDLIEATAVYRS